MKKTKSILITTVLVSIVLLAGCPEAPSGDIDPLTFSPKAGIYNYDQTVELSCSTAGAVIHYTVDGSIPNESSPVYSDPIAVNGHLTKTDIKAVAVCDGLTGSVSTGSYSIDYTVYPVMKGAISTGGGVNIANVKVGLFFKGHASGPHPTTNLRLSDDVDADGPSGRLYYNDTEVANGTDVSIEPNRIGAVDTAASTYTLPLPSEIPARSGTDWSEGYYAIAWYDTDGDGNLDLKNGAVTAYADQGEYNRMPIKSVELNGNANTSCYVDFIEQDELDPAGYQFKYYNVSNDTDYDHIALTSSTTGDFDFSIDAVTDTN